MKKILLTVLFLLSVFVAKAQLAGYSYNAASSFYGSFPILKNSNFKSAPGASADFQFNFHFAWTFKFGTGFRFNNFNAYQKTFPNCDTVCPTKRIASLNYVGVPLKIDFKIPLMNPSPYIGYQTNFMFLVGNKFKDKYVDKTSSKYDSPYDTPFMWGNIIRLGLDYRGDNIGFQFFLETSINTSFDKSMPTFATFGFGVSIHHIFISIL